MKHFTAIENNFYLSSSDKVLSFKGNSNTDKICFTVNRYCNLIDLSECTCTIKTKNKNGQSDIILPDISTDDNTISITWTVKSATTLVTGNLSVQIQFERLFEAETQEGDTVIYDASQTIAWQSNIINFEIKESLNSANEVYNEEPTLFQQWENRISEFTDDAADFAGTAVSAASQVTESLDLVNSTFIKVSEKNVANGVPTLNANAKLTSSQLDTSTDSAKIQLSNLSEEVRTAIETSSGGISSGTVEDDSITTAKLADNAVTTGKIADANITTAKLADNAVTTGKITDANIITAKLADDCITPEKTNFLGFKRVNYINSSQLTKGYISDSGTILNHFNSKIHTTDFIEVIPGNTYSCNLPMKAAYYDSSQAFIQTVNSIATEGSYGRKFTVPNSLNIAYVRLCGDTVSRGSMMNEGCIPLPYVPYDTMVPVISNSDLIDDILFRVDNNKNFSSKLIGAVWNCLGDSITSALGSDIPYHSILKSKYKMIINNHGIEGSQISYSSDPTKYSMVSRYLDMYIDAEIVTVFGGTNDFSNQVPIGTISSSDNTTFYGALNVLCAGLINTYHGKRIGFITPLQRNVTSDSSLTIPLTSYVQAIKDVCAKYSIPVLDLYNAGGLCPAVEYIKNNYYYIPSGETSSDGIHPNNLGHQVIAPKIESFLLSL